ncbi:MAG: sugar phosphate isomerase/epimerase [Armatimonadetes bacterium]|nr:sugar phosphate isomerase/epimerase [Armatimonadota bacterium]
MTVDDRMKQRAEAMIGRLGYNTACLPNRPLTECMSLGLELGLRGVELLSFADFRNSMGDLAGLYFDRLTDEQKAELIELTEPFDNLSIHAPFWDMLPFSPNPGVAEEARRQLRETLRMAGEIGASTVTTHVTPRTGYQWEEYRGDVVEFYSELGDVAAESGVTVTIETGFPMAVDEFASLVHDINHEAVGANVDVGHLRGNMSAEEKASSEAGDIYNELLAAHISSLGEKIYHMHLHDIRPSDFRDHRTPGAGLLDYPRLIRRLLDMDYTGLLVMELDEPDGLTELARGREFLVGTISAVAEDM